MDLYGIKNRSTIMVADSRTTGYYVFTRNLKYVTCADVCGCMNVNLTSIHPYNGKYGKGFVRVVPCYYNSKPSTKYMTIQYCVEK